jgi:phosphoenolpyruvate synthase/pyruvate phosphate dikinase
MRTLRERSIVAPALILNRCSSTWASSAEGRRMYRGVRQSHRRGVVRAARREPDDRLPRRLRYLSPDFADCFTMECDALRYVRDEMGLTNVKIIDPVRTDHCRSERGHCLAGPDRPAARRK